MCANILLQTVQNNWFSHLNSLHNNSILLSVRKFKTAVYSYILRMRSFPTHKVAKVARLVHDGGMCGSRASCFVKGIDPLHSGAQKPGLLLARGLDLKAAPKGTYGKIISGP